MMEYNLLGFQGARLAAIYLFLLVMLFLNVVDIPFMGAESGKLAFLMIGLYFWSVFRPSLLPYPLVFFIGLLLDFLAGGLVGLYALCFMVMVMVVRGQRRFLLGQSWLVIWAGFCVAASVVLLFQVLTYGVAYGTIPPLIPLLLNMLISFFMYPLFLPVMMLLNRPFME